MISNADKRKNVRKFSSKKSATFRIFDLSQQQRHKNEKEAGDNPIYQLTFSAELGNPAP